MSSFVTRSGGQLLLNGQPFRFAGVNLWWLGAILYGGTQGGAVAYPLHSMIDDGLATAVALGCRVVRSHSLGISVGSTYSLFPTLASLINETPNSAAFDSIDYAIARAGQLGFKLVIPLSDHNRFYTGGKHTFTDWRGISDEAQFYSDSQVISDYESYIRQYLTHVNPYTGLTYANDPTILCWETINEGYNPFPGATWTSTISAYIKSLDGNHLVLDGSYGVQSGNLSISTIDIVGNHLYPPQIALATSDATSASNAGKAYLIGEVDWRPGITGASGSFILDNTTAADGVQSVAVTTTGTSADSYYVQIAQQNIALSAGVTYTVTFWAKSTVDQSIQSGVQHASAPYTIYAQPYIPITTAWAQYSYTFDTGGLTDTDAQIVFNFAGAIATVWLDMVTLTAQGSQTNLLSDPSFENASLTPPWAFNQTTVSPDTYPAFASAVESNTEVSGDLLWQLMPHYTSGGFTLHDDNYSIYFPGDSAAKVTQLRVFRTHCYNMAGIAEPPAPLIAQAPQLLTASTGAGVGVENNTLTWLGLAGAASYTIQSAPTPDGPWTTVSTTATDMLVPWSDTSATTVYYRVAAVNADGVAGPYTTLTSVPSAYITTQL